MNRICLFLLATAFMSTYPMFAQKRVLDHSVYDSWKKITHTQLTPDGKVLAFQTEPQEGDGQLTIRVLKTGKEYTIKRGYNACISADGKWAYCLVKPLFSQTYQAKRNKVEKDDMPMDSVAWLNLATGKLNILPKAKSFRTGEKEMPYFAYLTAKPKEAADSVSFNKGKGHKGRHEGIDPLENSVKTGTLVVVNPQIGRCDSLSSVSHYGFNQDGTRLAVVTEPEKRDSCAIHSVCMYELPEMKRTVLSEGKAFYSLPSFSKDGDKLVFLASTDTLKSGNKHCSVMLYADNMTSEIIPQNYSNDRMPEGWTITENSNPRFALGGKRVWLGIAPWTAPADTTLADFEKAQVDVWHYADAQIQPQQKLNVEQARKKVYPTIINLDNTSKLIPLTTSQWDMVSPSDEGNGNYALSQDNTAYIIENQWTTKSLADISVINLADGSRREVAKALDARVQMSPDGKYLLWFNQQDSQWYTYNIESKKSVCLTKDCGTNFFDEEDDHPAQPDPYDRHPIWINGDKAVFICDRYDIWSFDPDGRQAVNLTQGYGRKNRLQLRHTDWTQEEESYRQMQDLGRYLKEKKAVKKGEKLTLAVFDEVSKKNGIGRISAIKAQLPEIACIDTFSFSPIIKAKDADVYAYQRGNFTTGADLYITQDFWKKQSKLTDINPQMKEFNWGTARLVSWKAYDGTPLNGLLYVPENIDPAKKYPVMIYFYEKRSETLYQPITPAPSRSTVNIPFFCSRGYLVFVPDIVYKDGHPGESAYNCIVSGAEAICNQFPYADKSRMAIQGQSWGGYQTAYLVTRTSMFKAAGAGAPVSNMTSAYGGIRWESGSNRAGQYEHGQSRIGKNLWENGGLELYLENSPLFKADKVETPLLIMHNDADGAVPWYQGIEYYIALRRNGKKVWMLEYNNEAHNLKERRNMKDLSIRLQQFFDYYLQDAPMPVWMKSGVPATKKGVDYGFDLTE